MELRNSFGPSNEFIRTLNQDIAPKEAKTGEIAQEVSQETEFVVSCSYEKETKWGYGVMIFL